MPTNIRAGAAFLRPLVGGNVRRTRGFLPWKGCPFRKMCTLLWAPSTREACKGRLPYVGYSRSFRLSARAAGRHLSPTMRKVEKNLFSEGEEYSPSAVAVGQCHLSAPRKRAPRLLNGAVTSVLSPLLRNSLPSGIFRSCGFCGQENPAPTVTFFVCTHPWLPPRGSCRAYARLRESLRQGIPFPPSFAPQNPPPSPREACKGRRGTVPSETFRWCGFHGRHKKTDETRLVRFDAYSFISCRTNGTGECIRSRSDPN